MLNNVRTYLIAQFHSHRSDSFVSAYTETEIICRSSVELNLEKKLLKQQVNNQIDLEMILEMVFLLGTNPQRLVHGLFHNFTSPP